VTADVNNAIIATIASNAAARATLTYTNPHIALLLLTKG
jgi:hypothetical protein